MSKWMPIKSAPTDGKRVLKLRAKGGEPFDGLYMKGAGWCALAPYDSEGIVPASPDEFLDETAQCPQFRPCPQCQGDVALYSMEECRKSGCGWSKEFTVYGMPNGS